MAKELPFFKFEISEWMFGRIQKQPLEIQGVFINLCCKYWHKLGEYSFEDAELDFGKDTLRPLIDSRIVGCESEYLIIKFLDTQLDECEQNSQKQRIKGLRSAQLRATRKQQKSTTVEHRLNAVQPNSTEENRIEENREEEKRIDEIGEKKHFHVSVKAKYVNDRPIIIYDLRLYFEKTGQLDALLLKKWDKFDEFIKENPANVFEDQNHLYNSFRIFHTKPIQKNGKNTNSAAITTGGGYAGKL